MKKQHITILLVAALIAVILILIFSSGKKEVETPTELSGMDAFVACIVDSGAQMYGASWCSHCNAQKDRFGKAKKEVPYNECSNPDRTQTEVCAENEITSYPTWIFGDGERVSGNLPLESIAQITGCTLPQG
jgi:membrane protein involved in colicin uptake